VNVDPVVALKVPLLSVLKVTVPVGVVGDPFVSVTVAVHVVAVPSRTVGGEQEIAVVVVSWSCTASAMSHDAESVDVNWTS
jgi:hypothetical protein